MRTAACAALLFLAGTAGSQGPPPVPPSPPMPLPVLPAASSDTTELRACLRLPLGAPGCDVLWGYDGWYEIGSRAAEAPARIAEIKSHLRGDASDAERYDELCRWYDLVGNDDESRICLARAISLCRERLKSLTNDAVLLSRLGNLLLSDVDRRADRRDYQTCADPMSEAHRTLVQACKADPKCWRPVLTLARLDLTTAKLTYLAYQEASEQTVNAPTLFPQQQSLSFLHRPFQDIAGPHSNPMRSLPELLKAEVGLPEKPMPRPAEAANSPKGPESLRECWNDCWQAYYLANVCMKRAFALAPNEPAILLYRVSERQFLATLQATGDPSKQRAAVDAVLADADSLADIRASLAARPNDIDLICSATFFEVLAATNRSRPATDRQSIDQAYGLFLEPIQRLESIAARSDGPTAARASLAAAFMCRKIGQRFRANYHIHFALASDPNNPKVWESYLAELAEDGPASKYLAVGRRCAERFDKPEFQLRLADALARSGDTAGALGVVQQLRRREPDHVVARLAEAIYLLKIGEKTETPRAIQLLDETAAAARQESDAQLQHLCEILRACAQVIGGNATLGRVMLDDLARRQPDDAIVKGVLAALGD
jgi:tetratricopeptide (TPR) repeat protein